MKKFKKTVLIWLGVLLIVGRSMFLLENGCESVSNYLSY